MSEMVQEAQPDETADATDATDVTDVPVGDGEGISPEDPDRGAKTALVAERQRRKELERELKEFRDRAEQDRLASMSDQERAVEQARSEGREQAAAELRAAHVSVLLRASATAAGFADPQDVAGLIDMDGLEPDGVEDAVAKLAEAKPYLLKAAVPPPIPQGQRGSSAPAESTMDDWLRQASRRGGRL